MESLRTRPGRVAGLEIQDSEQASVLSEEVTDESGAFRVAAAVCTS
jgi:hypothetical protein